MRRRLGWLVLAVVTLTVLAVVLAVVTVRPDLADKRDRTDRAWTPLRVPLVARYQALAGVEVALHMAGAGSRTVTKDLDAALTRWRQVARVDDPATQAPLADDLEGLALRVKANLVASPRLQSDPGVGAAVGGFDRTVVSPPAVDAYNRAVVAYQHARTGTIRGLAADAFGFGARPELKLGGG
jgi:hypothetical protein